MRIIGIICLAVVIGIIGSYVQEYLYNRFICTRLKLINRYLKVLNKNDVMIRYKNKVFYIIVDSLLEDPVYKKLLYINEELVLTAYELNHGYTNSRQLEYNHKRSENEINKLLKLAYKKLKRLYYDEYLKIDYSFTSFWED